MADFRPKMSDLARPATDGKELVQWARAQHRKGKGLHQVAPGVYLGNKQAAALPGLLHAHGVVAVCAVGAKPNHHEGLIYHHVSVKDNGNDSMFPFLDDSCDFIHRHRCLGAVLVHCKGGISRSPCLLVAYLMKYEDLSISEALEVVSLAQPAARCPANFFKDLEGFSQEKASETSGPSEQNAAVQRHPSDFRAP
mmetsp:Transcript_37922/g.70737  ORF Transcript_37922/g.70737 Transcript_37922/m.70737 type:complete len:195 (+) Transcript_37922:53-637(+)